jgi:hypothetical protein
MASQDLYNGTVATTVIANANYPTGTTTSSAISSTPYSGQGLLVLSAVNGATGTLTVTVTSNSTTVATFTTITAGAYSTQVKGIALDSLGSTFTATATNSSSTAFSCSLILLAVKDSY